MKKSFFVFSFLTLLIPVFNFNSFKELIKDSEGVTVINSVETEAEGSNAKTESKIITNVNGNETTVEINQPGSVEVKNVNGKVEIKTSEGITPTIIVTGVPTQSAGQSSFSKIINEKTVSIYCFLRGFFKKVFSSIFSKT